MICKLSPGGDRGDDRSRAEAEAIERRIASLQMRNDDVERKIQERDGGGAHSSHAFHSVHSSNSASEKVLRMKEEAERLEAMVEEAQMRLDAVVANAARRKGELRIAEARDPFASPPHHRTGVSFIGGGRDIDVRAERMQPSLHLESGTRRRKGTETPVLQPLHPMY